MASSGRLRHRDREPGTRQIEPRLPEPADRVFRITNGQREEIAEALRRIDEARSLLEAQHKRENREMIRDLRQAADHIFDVLNELDEL
jgi:DNA-binding PadR family transcriptional regulator